MKMSISQLGLNLCGTMNTCRVKRTPLLITTRREVTHLIVPVSSSEEAEKVRGTIKTTQEEINND